MLICSHWLLLLLQNYGVNAFTWEYSPQEPGAENSEWARRDQTRTTKATPSEDVEAWSDKKSDGKWSQWNAEKSCKGESPKLQVTKEKSRLLHSLQNISLLRVWFKVGRKSSHRWQQPPLFNVRRKTRVPRHMLCFHSLHLRSSQEDTSH